MTKAGSSQVHLVQRNCVRGLRPYFQSKQIFHVAKPQFEHGLEPVTQEELRRVVHQCTFKTCDLHPCPPDLLKKTLDAHIPYLVVVVNDSYQWDLFSKALKTALVRPLLKKEGLDASMLASHRPVSNIPFISKVLEKVAVNCLLKHPTLTNLYEEYQSAYRMPHSTETALLGVQHDIVATLDQNRAVILVLLDFSGAFDNIDQWQLLHLLETNYGMTRTALS